MGTDGRSSSMSGISMSPAPPSPKAKRRPALRRKAPDNRPTPPVSETPRPQPGPSTPPVSETPRPQPGPRPQPQPEPAPAPQPVPPEPAPAPVKGAGPAGSSTRGAQGEIGDEKEALAASQADLAKLRDVRRARLIKASILAAIAVVFITFVLQNASPVALKILGWTLTVRLIWVIVVSALLGAGAGYLVGRPDKELLLHGPSRRQEDPR